MFTRNVYQSSVEGEALPIGSVWDADDLLAKVPVLLETILLLDIVAQEQPVDLKSVTDIILSDAGAVLQVLRLAARMYTDDDGPKRLEDCLTGIGLAACIQAIASADLVCGSEAQGIRQVWSHLRDVAQLAREIALDSLSLDPDRAYLAGILHNVTHLPELLGMRQQGWFSSNMHLLMPQFVQPLLTHSGEDSKAWAELIEDAEQLCVLRAYRAEEATGDAEECRLWSEGTGGVSQQVLVICRDREIYHAA